MNLSDTDVIRIAEAICAKGPEVSNQFKFHALGVYLDRIAGVEKKVELLDREKLRGVTTPEVERIVAKRIRDSNEIRNDLLKDRFKQIETRIENLKGATDAVKTG